MSVLQTLSAEQSRELKKLLESITHSGSKTICKDELQALLKLTENSDDYVKAAFGILKGYLKKEHSEVRFSTVQLYDELLSRYETFKELVLERLDKFFKYALGIKCSLPPPDPAARSLVTLAISVFDKWHSRFGSNCLKLRNGYSLLKDVHNVDFAERSFIDPKAKREKEENRKRLLKINKERLKNYNKQMDDLMPEMEAALTSIDSCFELLLPSDDLVKGHSHDSETDDESEMRLYGVLNSREFKVEIQIDDIVTVVEDEENSSILEAAKDSYKIINNSFLPKVIVWVELISVAEGGREMLTSALHLKDRMNRVITKYNSLKIVKPIEETHVQNDSDEDEVSSDSDLEEVVEPKRDKKTVTREEIGFLSECMNLYNNRKQEGESSKNVNTIQKNAEDSSNDEKTACAHAPPGGRKAELLKVAPKLPFDVDLYHWEDEKLPTPTLIPKNTEGGRFWGTSLGDCLDELPVPGGSESLRSRVIEFTGQFEPVTRACRAALPSGKLCPRHDRKKCPLHGTIVDRDEQGNLVNPEDAEKVKNSKKTPDVPDWQDPKLLAEIKAATGVDLKMPTKGQRMKKKKHPGLTDLNPKIDTPEARLSKKIFNRRAMKRVASTLDKLDQKRFRDKFGDQFNYVHDTT